MDRNARNCADVGTALSAIQFEPIDLFLKRPVERSHRVEHALDLVGRQARLFKVGLLRRDDTEPGAEERLFVSALMRTIAEMGLASG